MVMLSHYYPVLGLTYDDGMISLCLNFGYLGVAVFFLLSGYGAMISKMNKPDYLKHYIPKRLIRLYLPFVIVFVINILILLVMGEEIKISYVYSALIMSLPNTLNWYLKIQIILYIVFYILARISKKDTIMILLMFILSTAYMIVGFVIGITSFWYETVFAFPLGMLLARYKTPIIELVRRRRVITALIVFFAFIVCFAPYYFMGGTIFEIVFIFGFLLLIVYICTFTYGDFILTTKMGKASLELYLVHIVLINSVISKMQLADMNYGASIAVFLGYVTISVIIGILLNAVVTHLNRAIIGKMK